MQQQLRSLRQVGSVLDYTAQFQNIVGQIEGIGSLDQVTNYIEGLKPATKMEVAYQAPTTLTDAIAHATRFDNAMFGMGRPGTMQNFSHKPFQHRQQ